MKVQHSTFNKETKINQVYIRQFVAVNRLYVVKVKLSTVVEADQKAPFSIATTQRCRGKCYSFPWIAPLYPWYVPYIVECWVRRCQVSFLKSLVWRELGLNLGLTDHWWTLYHALKFLSLMLSFLVAMR